MSNISIIIQREFNERVRKKSFIITTLLMQDFLRTRSLNSRWMMMDMLDMTGCD